MDGKTLKQYKMLKKEAPKLRKDIEKLYEKLGQIQTVFGKVTKSSDDFPYIEQHVTVQMEDPEVSSRIRDRIRIKEKRLEQIEKIEEQIEKFISEIPDSRDRQIIEMIYLDGMKQEEVGRQVGYTQSMISKIVEKNLKDS